MNSSQTGAVKFITDIFYRLTAGIIKIILRINGKLTVKGKENVPSDGGLIIASNHISYLDPPVLGAVSPRRITFMAKKGLFDIPLVGRIIKFAAFPVDRDNPKPSTIKETIKRLTQGEVITIFPEGTRSETGELLEAKRGLGMIAGLSKATVVPALLIGTDRALPVNAKFLKRADITVVFGKPIYYNSIAGNKDLKGHQLHDAISAQVMASIEKLKGDIKN